MVPGVEAKLSARLSAGECSNLICGAVDILVVVNVLFAIHLGIDGRDNRLMQVVEVRQYMYGQECYSILCPELFEARR